MKKFLHTLLAIVFAWPIVVAAQEADVPARQKVAVVLSGGGAKGVAHIGALKVIEEAGIPIDMIVGTSMGAIVGGLYSIGYTTEQLDSMVMSQNWGLLLSDKPKRKNRAFSQREADTKYVLTVPFGKNFDDVMVGGLVKGSNLEMLFTDMMIGYHDTLSFDRLPIPFACVAADVVDGSEVVFHEGVLPVAMRASMAIPGFFTPVYTDDKVLVDGGVVNNFPTDVAREMGADIIIGVDVQAELRSKDELQGAPAIIGQLIDLSMQQRKYGRNVRLADVYMKVDVKGYSSASFNLPALDSLIRRGHEAADKEWNELVDLRNRICPDETYELPVRKPYLSLSERGHFKVRNISFGGLTDREKKWVLRKAKLHEGGEVDMEAIKRGISILNATQSYSDVYYTLCATNDPDFHDLDFHMTRVKNNSLNLGVNFDSEEIAAVLLNGTFRFGKNNNPSRFSLTGRFGKRITAQADLFLYPGPMSNFNFTYAYQHNDIVLYHEGRKFHNLIYNYHLTDIGYNEMNFWRQNLKLSLGMRYEYFIGLTNLSNSAYSDVVLPTPVTEGLISYYAGLQYESLDNHYFPHRGTMAAASYDLYTDNFVQYRGNSAFSAIAFSWMTAFPLSNRFTFIPYLYGRVMSGVDIPFWYTNMIGGKWFSRYVPHQMQFDGIGFMEAIPNAFVAARLKGQQRIGRNHYVTATLNYALGDTDFFNLFAGRQYFGASLNYGYDTRFGPLKVSFNWSNVTRRLGFYLQFGYTF